MAADLPKPLPRDEHRYSLRDVVLIITTTGVVVAAFMRLDGSVRVEVETRRTMHAAISANAERLAKIEDRLHSIELRLRDGSE